METPPKRDLIILGSGSRVIVSSISSGKNSDKSANSLPEITNMSMNGTNGDKKFVPPKSIGKKKSPLPHTTNSACSPYLGSSGSDKSFEESKEPIRTLFKPRRSIPPSCVSRNEQSKSHPHTMKYIDKVCHDGSEKSFEALKTPDQSTPQSSAVMSEKAAFDTMMREVSEAPYDADVDKSETGEIDDDNWDEIPLVALPKSDDSLKPHIVSHSESEKKSLPKSQEKIANIIKNMPAKGAVDRPNWANINKGVSKSKDCEKLNLKPAGMNARDKPKIVRRRRENDTQTKPKNAHSDFKVNNIKFPPVRVLVNSTNAVEIEWNASNPISSKRCPNYFEYENYVPKPIDATSRNEKQRAHVTQLLEILKVDMLSNDQKLEDLELTDELKEQLLNLKLPDTTKVKRGSNGENDEKIDTPEEHCKCVTCDGWSTCAQWRSRNVYDDNDECATLLSDDGPTDMSRKIIEGVLVHGRLIPEVKSKVDNLINDDVKLSLEELNCDLLNAVQNIVCRAILRGMNVCVVDEPKSGKTLSYLPVICTFLMDKFPLMKEENSSVVALILCNGQAEASNVNKLAYMLLSNLWDNIPEVKLLEMTSQRQETDYDLLITSPDVLEKHLKLGNLNLKQLSVVVLENCQDVLKNYTRIMEKLITYLNVLTSTRPKEKTLQFISICEHWSLDVQTLLTKLRVTPMVCFRDYFKAAIYSGVNFLKKSIKSSEKKFYLEDLLKKHYLTSKTVVFCENNVINDLSDFLTIKGIENFKIFDNILADDYDAAKDAFNSTSKGYHRVLLCTDKAFGADCVVNADWLVNFSIPSNWATYMSRHRCMVDNFKSPFIPQESNWNCRSFMIIDETVNQEDEILVKYFNSISRMVVGKFNVRFEHSTLNP